MGTDFLGALADSISSQFSLGENQTHTLDAVIDGQQTKYGSLGDFASQFDQSEVRRYVEEGYLRRDPYNTDPKTFQVLLQEPNGTILVKKKFFASIGENYRPDYMNSDEKLYYRAMTILFQNKCNQISALEKLSKIQKITSAVGQIDTQLMPVIFSLGDLYASGINAGSNFFGIDTSIGGATLSGNQNSFISVLSKLRKVYAYNQDAQYTSWITDPTSLFNSQFAQGTGVIEITNFTTLSTSVTTSIESPGTFQFNISDPYETMVITEWDIEKAISDATNSFYNHKSFQFGQQAAEDTIKNLTAQLNQARSARKVSPISWVIDPNTLLGRRVTAILDRLGIELQFQYDSTGGTGFPGLGGFGNSVSVDPSFIKGGAVAGFDGLSQDQTPTGPDNNIRRAFPSGSSELELFKSLVSAIYNKIQMDANSQGAFQGYNQNTNYARRKLRFNFCGKLIIQPMDTVHIYLSSKSRWDNRISAGLQNMFTGAGILQNINNTLTDFTNSFNSLFNPSKSIPMQVEKAIYVGPAFPNFLWNMVRNQFVTERDGTHVFAGVVERATDNWSDGKFSIDVGGKDNSFYFEQGKVNFKPGLDVYNGSAFDPLTPFKTNFDTVNSDAKSNNLELLDENKFIIGETTDKSIVKAKLGPLAGSKVTQCNYIQDKSYDPGSRQHVKIFYAPDGLAYQWKEGIGIFTQTGDLNVGNDPNLLGEPNQFKDPFAGQDIMNVISLLITGVPYNFATFYKGVVGDNNYGRDPHSNEDPAYAFINSLKTQITKNNTLWGNFIPFKNLSIDEKTYALAQQNQFRVTQLNGDLDNKLKLYRDLSHRAALFNSLNAYDAQNNTGNTAPPFLDLQSQIKTLRKEIDNIIQQINSQNKSFFQQSGADTSFDVSEFIDSNTGGVGAEGSKYRRYLRKQINALTRRMSYDVRANDDKNFFIVDDFYDKDWDVLAYDQSLTDGIQTFSNEFTSVREKIIQTSQLLNMEVFCDSQGHIRARSPQYNRMPSSVFYRMMYLKNALGIQIFPDYLNNLFTDQINTLKEQVEIIEDEIRLDCALLGYDSDSKALAFIQQYANQNTASSFSFISDSNGSISDMKMLTRQVTGDIQAQNQNLAPTPSNFAAQAGIKNIFTNSQRYSVIVDALKVQASNQNGIPIVSPSTLEQSTVINDLINRINSKSGQNVVSTKDYIDVDAANISDISLPPNRTIDVFKVTEELAKRFSERQNAMKLFYSTVKNSVEFRALDDSSSPIANQMIESGNYGNSHVPEAFEHMIEDESQDDYGVGSGQRYVIKRAQIKQLSIHENPPDATVMQVQGIFTPLLANGPEGFNNQIGSGNGLTTALAVDYDMWRTYGFKQQVRVPVPFLSDPVTQCGPYAAMLLSRNRKNILRGSITISGNEYMQPGEVIFIEDRGLLFYVTSVKHSFTYAQGFTTSMELSYGHTPGEYIPTPMDFIGKMIYKNKDTGSTVVQRQVSATGDINVGVLLMDPKLGPDVSMSISDTDKTGINAIVGANADSIKNILFQCAYMISATSANTQDSSPAPVVEVRYYHDSTTSASSNIQKFATNVWAALINGMQPASGSSTSTTSNLPAGLPASSVNQPLSVDLDDVTDYRSPSQKAIDAARNFAASSSSSSGVSLTGGKPPDQGGIIKKKLFENVVDVWVTFPPRDVDTTSGS